MASTTDTLARTVLDKEADARFWSATNFKVGQKLDPKIPADAAMIKTWIKFYNQVKAENNAGHLVLTYTHPAVAQPLAAAAAADQVAAAHMKAAQTSTDPAAAAQHVAIAATATAQSQNASTAAAAAQPPPPVAPREVATDTRGIKPPRSPHPEDHQGHAQANSAATAVAAAHGASASTMATGQGPMAAIHPIDLAAAQAEARALAASSPAAFVGIAKAPGDPAHVEPFASYGDGVEWFDHGVASREAQGSYLALFNKHDASWPGPVSDGIGAEAALIVLEHPDAHPPQLAAHPAQHGKLPVVEVRMPGGVVDMDPPMPEPDFGAPPGAAVAIPPPPGSDGGKTAMLIGGGLVAAGLAALALSGSRTRRRGPSMSRMASSPPTIPARRVPRMGGR